MVTTIKGDIHICDVCGERSLDKTKLEEHEKSPINPLFSVGEEVAGHYSISENPAYAFTSFRVLEINKEKHVFKYNLEPTFIQAYHSRPHYYSGPCIPKKGSEWSPSNEEDKKVLDSLEGKLSDIPLNCLTISLSEDKIRPQLKFGG